MKSGEKIDIRTDTEYQTTARAEMERSMNLSQKAAAFAFALSKRSPRIARRIVRWKIPRKFYDPAAFPH